MCVNFSHGLIIASSADLHREFFGEAEMKGERAKTMPQTVHTDSGKAILPADSIDGAIERVDICLFREVYNATHVKSTLHHIQTLER